MFSSIRQNLFCILPIWLQTLAILICLNPIIDQIEKTRDGIKSVSVHWCFFPVHFISVAQLCLTCCDPRDCSMLGFHVHHQLLELAQTHVHQGGDAVHPSHPLSFSSPPAFNLSQHWDLFQRVSSSHQVAKVLEFQLQHQSFQ